MITVVGVLGSHSLFAIPEDQVLLHITPLIENARSFTLGEFASPVKYGNTSLKVRYARFGTEQGKLGSLVIAPGRTESSIKYIEVALDFIEFGFSPVYVIDHRGQGLSDRWLEDPSKGHVEQFEDYVTDFSHWIDEIVLKDSTINKDRLYLISNSMGGAISFRYLQKVGLRGVFRASAHGGAMLQVKYPGGVSEKMVLLQTYLICELGLPWRGLTCDGYAPGQRPFDNSNRDASLSQMTHSKARYQMQELIYAKYPQTKLGGATIRWVQQAARINKHIREPKNLALIQTPVLLLTAQKDIRVEEAAHQEVCETLGTKICQRELILGSKHEILMEVDSIRQPAIKSIVDFFSLHK